MFHSPGGVPVQLFMFHSPGSVSVQLFMFHSPGGVPVQLFMCHSPGGVPVQLCAQPTNGVTYFRAVSDLGSLPAHLEPYVPLFCNVVTKYVTNVFNSVYFQHTSTYHTITIMTMSILCAGKGAY